MASPAPRPEEGPPFRVLLHKRIAFQLIVIVLLSVVAQMRVRCDDDRKDDSREGRLPGIDQNHPKPLDLERRVFEGLEGRLPGIDQNHPKPLDLERRVVEGLLHNRRGRRNPQRSPSSPLIGSNHPDVGQPCPVTSCNARTVPGNLTTKAMMKRYREDSIKDEILRKLRMDSVPNITTIEQRELTSMRRFFNRYGHGRYPPTANQTAEEEYSTPMTIIVQSQSVPRVGFNVSNTCYFEFLSPTYQSDQVVTAQMGIYLHSRNDPVPRRDDRVQYLLIKRNQRRWGYQQQQQQQQHSTERNHRGESYRRKTINASNPIHFGRWHYFDVKNLVQAWINQPERNFGITVSTSDASLQSLVVVQPRRPDEERLRPYVTVELRPSSSSSSGGRATRSVGGSDCSDDSQERRCCRYPLIIDFEAFRWDWIIAPKKYEAFYCSGECPFLVYQSNPHTHLFQQVAAPPIGVPCCSPTHVSPLPLIYMDEALKRIVYSSIPGMIVDKCGCS